MDPRGVDELLPNGALEGAGGGGGVRSPRMSRAGSAECGTVGGTGFRLAQALELALRRVEMC